MRKWTAVPSATPILSVTKVEEIMAVVRGNAFKLSRV
jgi:hypothetical protein